MTDDDVADSRANLFLEGENDASMRENYFSY